MWNVSSSRELDGTRSTVFCDGPASAGATSSWVDVRHLDGSRNEIVRRSVPCVVTVERSANWIVVVSNSFIVSVDWFPRLPAIIAAKSAEIKLRSAPVSGREFMGLPLIQHSTADISVFPTHLMIGCGGFFVGPNVSMSLSLCLYLLNVSVEERNPRPKRTLLVKREKTINLVYIHTPPCTGNLHLSVVCPME